MQPMTIYLLKMLITSAVLFGYYWIALRNERFHQWNRFYLLSAMLMSMVLPLINIPLMADEPTPVVAVVAELPWNKVTVSAKAQNGWSWNHSVALLSVIISFLLLLHLLLTVARVVRLYKRHHHTQFNDINVVLTDEQSAPFSFFKWLFWRSDIDPDSASGQRMLKHELTHISEKHSADKIFTELVLVLFWMNPLFWIMRRELYAIHEFLADQKAIARYDGSAFAAMILQASHPGLAPSVVNPFFTSHLKRRLIMITTSKAPKYSYLRRLSGFVLMLTTAATIVLSIDQASAQKAPPPPPAPPAAPKAPKAISLPDSIKTIDIWDKKGTCMVTIKMADGRILKMDMNEAKKKGYPVEPPPPPPPAPPAPASAVAPVAPAGSVAPVAPLPPTPPADPKPATTPAKKGLMAEGFAPGKTPLFIYAGLEITNDQMQQLDPNMIESIEVLKGEKATSLYGEKGENGVIKITPKSTASFTAKPSEGLRMNDVVVVGYASKSSEQKKPGLDAVVVEGRLKEPAPVTYVNGKKATASETKAIEANTIASVNVLKGEKAVAKYGEEGKQGVVEIQTRPAAEVPVFTSAESMPQYPGGSGAWQRYLERNLQYPADARQKKIEGVAKVQFVVDVNGNMYDFVIAENPGGGLGEEALRIIKKGPKWEPAVQNGKKVNARVTQAVAFKLN